MNLFTYVYHLDASQKQFTFTQVEGNLYLQFGLLNEEQTRLYVSIIAGGFVGFFRDGKETAYAQIVADYDADNGVQIQSIPNLRAGFEYQIKWTQARPGAPGADADTDPVDIVSDVPLDVTLIRKIQIDGLEEHNLTFEYNIGSSGRPGIEWGVLWYGSIADLEAGTPELPRDRTPLNVSITPPILSEAEGLHFFHLAFTPQFEGEHYLAFVLDPLPDGQRDEPEPDMPVFPYLVDASGDWLVDADGNILVSAAEQVIFLTDEDGYELVDADGNRIAEVI
ncbi:MAG: hypothetical protein F4118_10040 [Acidimicrobiaceae bacterium]|nr:hypothetical protein [Candidatus Poribacteria bacterium]MYI36749.1 hypothetical protein [Acidimicrobiaceae bacterium]